MGPDGSVEGFEAMGFALRSGRFGFDLFGVFRVTDSGGQCGGGGVIAATCAEFSRLILKITYPPSNNPVLGHYFNRIASRWSFEVTRGTTARGVFSSPRCRKNVVHAMQQRNDLYLLTVRNGRAQL